ncbi:hypothetical protein [Streptomyces sp. NBC_00094]|uniref:hypothetical protein n=1 Tax=Streptomyces sp. NBC_00094 TaxID=2903620 RepID=UPI00225983C7|nr:hypothetical protein [Streptomyces sp. NBC_00094]MCX5395035.1 hypothetical protein [Streptomyces sp. NBC_00094]
MTWVFNLAFGPVEVALPLFVTAELHADVGLLGAYWVAFGIGAVIGALALGAAGRLPLWSAVLGIIAGHGIGLLPFSFTHTALPSVSFFELATDRVIAIERFSVEWVAAASGACSLVSRDKGPLELAGLNANPAARPVSDDQAVVSRWL